MDPMGRKKHLKFNKEDAQDSRVFERGQVCNTSPMDPSWGSGCKTFYFKTGLNTKNSLVVLFFL